MSFLHQLSCGPAACHPNRGLLSPGADKELLLQATHRAMPLCSFAHFLEHRLSSGLANTWDNPCFARRGGGKAAAWQAQCLSDAPKSLNSLVPPKMKFAKTKIASSVMFSMRTCGGPGFGMRAGWKHEVCPAARLSARAAAVKV